MKTFFDTVRPAFRGGKLSEAQVAGLSGIVAYGRDKGYMRSHLAYVLATTFHETGERMTPLREGFAKTDSGAYRAVASMFAKGIIRKNYALRDKAGNSFYGRGYVQLTHKTNYKKMEAVTGLPLSTSPDAALEVGAAMDILFIGMSEGMFRKGRSLDMIPAVPSLQDFRSARGIINGDVRRNGTKVAEIAIVFYNALLDLYTDISVEAEDKEHSLWCRLLDLVGLGDH